MSSGMTRIVVLILALAAGGCAMEFAEQEPIEESELGETSVSVSEDEAAEERVPGTPSTSYERAGEVEPGEEQSGPHPEPWQNVMGPHPEPWGPEQEATRTATDIDSNREP